MYPMASQYMFEAASSRFCAKISDSDASKNSKRSQFEIENILKSNFCDKSVTAGDEIEKNSMSHEFSFDQLSFDESLSKKFSASVQSDGFIAPQDANLKHKFWLRNIRVADDIPGANVLLEMTDEKVELKAIKVIKSSDELLLWFSEEILNVMGIPFLTPANIQGKRKFL